MRRLYTYALLLVPLCLVAAAWPVQAIPNSTPGENEPQTRIVTVYDWIRVLPAPPTVEGWSQPDPALQWPLRGVLTQPFGCTQFELERPVAGCPGGFHTGLDIGQPEGIPIRAAATGLAYSFTDDQRYGNHVLIQHQGGYSTLYGHMVRTNVGWAQAVATGEVVGWVGSTGNSTGPHLHFEVRFAGAPLDPMPYLDGAPPPPQPLPAGWPGAPRDDGLGRR